MKHTEQDKIYSYHLLHTASNITDHLDFDERFLQYAESHLTNLYLRFWECPTYSVVLGRSNQSTVEVNESFCKQKNISIHKRCSGGGTVLLGPGSLCYSLYIPCQYEGCESISSSNQTIMSHNKTAIATLLDDVTIQGHTDLCIDKTKFSGNAQRRKKRYLLFHGTFLYNFDLTLISSCLQHPSKEPSYREKRPHSSFLQNIDTSSQDIQNAMLKVWGANKIIDTSHFNF